MMSADMSSTLSPSMPVLKRVSPDAPRVYARGKFYARPMPTLHMTAPPPTHTPAPENKPATVTSVHGARDERAQSVIKLAVTMKSGMKTMIIAPEPKVIMVRVEDAVRLGRLESRSNGRYRVRQEPIELKAPATHKHAHERVEGAKIPGVGKKVLTSTGDSAEPNVTSDQPKVAIAECAPVCVTGLDNGLEEADQGPPTLTTDDYFAKLSEEKGRMINRVFARIASVSSSHEDQQKNAANAVGVIRRPEYEDISDEEDCEREKPNSQTQHAFHNSSQTSSDYRPETVAVNHRENRAKDTRELLSVLEGTDNLMGGTEEAPRRQLYARRTSAPELVDIPPPKVRVALHKTTRSASLPCADDAMDKQSRYPKMRISRCSDRNWKVIDKTPPKAKRDAVSAATHPPPPITAGQGGEEEVTIADSPVKSGETCVITSTDKSVAEKVQAGAVSDVHLTTTGAPSGNCMSLPQNLAPSVVVNAQSPMDANPVLEVEGEPASRTLAKEIPRIPGVQVTATTTSDGDRASSDAVRRLSQEKSNARPEVIAASNGDGVVQLAPKDVSATVSGQTGLSQREVETISGTEIPLLNDLGLGSTKETSRKRGRPPLQSLKKEIKDRSWTPPLPTPKKTVARKKSTSRRNFRHESIQTFKPTTAPPPWRYKGRAHVRSPDITLAPQRKLSVELNDAGTEIGPVSSPSPNELVIDLNPDMTETEVAGDRPEVDSVARDRRYLTTESSLRRALSDPGNCGAVNVPPKGATKEAAAETPEKRDLSPSALNDDGSDGRKKIRKKDEGGDVVHAVQARLATKQHHEKGRRLAQELPGYNWLEEKILNGGVTQVLPPKIAPPAPSVATCVGDIPEVAMRLASVTENLVITKVQNLQHPSIITGVSASVDVQKPALAMQGQPVGQVHSIERDSIARRTLIQLANGGDMQVTMERIPPQNSGVLNCDQNDMRRHEEAYVAKQLLHDFNAKNQLNQENLKRIESLAAQQRNCTLKMPAAKPPPANWGFTENVATMARHTATSFDTGVGLTRGYPGPLPHEILPQGNPRIANGMAQSEPRVAPQRLATLSASSAHSAISTLATLPPTAAERVGARRASGEQTRSPQYPSDMYRIPQRVDGPQHASREQNQKQSAETAEAHRLLFHEQQKMRGIHPRPAVPTATAAATARSSFPSLPEPAQTQPMLPNRRQEPLQPPIRHQQQPQTYPFPDHLVNPTLAQNRGNSKREERNPQVSLPTQANHGFVEPSFISPNVGQIPPQFLPGNQFAQHQGSMHATQSAEVYRDIRNGHVNVADSRNVPVSFSPSRLLQQTLLKPDGRSRPVQEKFQHKGQGGQAPNHRSPTEQAAVPSSVNDHLNSQMFMTNSQYIPMTQTHPNLPPQALYQLRQQKAQKMAEQWRNEMERGRFAQTTRVEATHVNRISPNAPPQRFASPQQRATNQLGHASIHDGPLNHPFQLPPFSPPFTSVPGQTVYRPPVPPHQQSFKAPQHPHIDMVQPANPQNAVPNYQQIPYNFQPGSNLPPRYTRNVPNDYLELLQKRAIQLEFEQQEAKRRHHAQRSAMQKEEQLHKETQREIARLEAEKAKTFQEALQEEGRLRLEQQQADLAARHEPPAIHAQAPWSNVIHHQMHQHQSRDQQTISPRSEQHQPGPQQRVHMSGGHVSPRFVQQQLSPQVAGAKQVHNQKCCLQDPQEIQHMKLQHQMNNQVTQVLQYPQMSSQSMLLIQQQKQNVQSPQQVQAQMNALSVHESQRQLREHEHRILQQQQHQSQRNINPLHKSSSPNQPLNPLATGSRRSTVNGSNKDQQNAGLVKEHITSSLDNTQKLIESSRDISDENSRVVRSKKMLHTLLKDEAREVSSLPRNSASDPTTAVLHLTKNKVVESSGPSKNVEYQIGTKQRFPVRERVENDHHRSNSRENEINTEVPNKNSLTTEACNKVHVEGLQCQLPQAGLGDHSSSGKPLPPLQPLPLPVRKMPELEKLLVPHEDLHPTVTDNSDLQSKSLNSGGADDSITIVDLDSSGDEESEDMKLLPRAHQASFFSTATMESGRERFSHKPNAVSKYAADNEPIDLSAGKRKASNAEAAKPPKKVASSSVVASLLLPISTGKIQERRAESVPSQNLPELRSQLAANDIKEKQFNIQQKTPPETKVTEEPDAENGKPLNTKCLHDSKTQIVEASPKVDVNKDKFEDIPNPSNQEKPPITNEPTKPVNEANEPTEENQLVLLQKQDSKSCGEASQNENHDSENGTGQEFSFVKELFPKKDGTDRSEDPPATEVQPVAEEPRVHSYSNTNGDEMIKAKSRTLKPINSHGDELNSIQEATESLENGPIAENISESEGTVAISRPNVTKLPFQQISRTILQFKGFVNESRNGAHRGGPTMPSQSNRVRNDGRKNILTTVTTKVCQARKADNTFLRVTQQTVQRSIIPNEPSLQNVVESASNSGESGCTIQIANIYTVKDVNPDGTYNERAQHDENQEEEPKSDDDLSMKKTEAKVLTKQSGLPNPSTSPHSIENRESSVDEIEMKKDINDNEGPPSGRTTLKEDRASALVSQKRKSSEDSEIPRVSEGPTASKLLKQVSVIHQAVAPDAANANQTHFPADNSSSCAASLIEDSFDQSDDCILVDEYPMDVQPTSSNDTQSSRTQPTPVAKGNPRPRQQVECRPTCDVCGTFATCSCSICQHVFYCSRECQRSHWNIHGPQCKRWAAEWKP